MSEDNKDSQSPDDALADEWAAALEQQADEEGGGDDQDPAEMASFDTLEDESGDMASTGEVNMDAILDVPVTISMEIGRTNVTIRNLLQLNQGSVVELDRLAGEPMDVLVNGTLIAQGEVVVVNEKFGIRLTDIISQSERVKRLQ
jgi:flagellar motor switch protein FliN/FliY